MTRTARGLPAPLPTSALRRSLLRLSLAAALLAIPTVSRAQSPTDPAPPAATAPPVAPPAVAYTRSLAVDPIGLPLGIFSAEYQSALQGGFVVGVRGTASTLSDFHRRISGVEGKALYFPSEVPMQGIAVGLTAGFEHVTRTNAGVGVIASASAPTVGVVVAYDLPVGVAQRLMLGGGAGLRRVINRGAGSPLADVYPDLRLVVGLRF